MPLRYLLDSDICIYAMKHRPQRLLQRPIAVDPPLGDFLTFELVSIPGTVRVDKPLIGLRARPRKLVGLVV